MPNKRHPARKFIGFWGTTTLKERMKKYASKKNKTLSVVIAEILLEYLTRAGVELIPFGIVCASKLEEFLGFVI
jgi:hypothetical protein